MDNNKIMEIIKAHLAQAEADLKACGRGSNHGRVAALKSLLEAIEQEAKKS